MSLLLLSLIIFLLILSLCVCYTPDTKDTYVATPNLFNTISTGKKLVSDKNVLETDYYKMNSNLKLGIDTTSIADDIPFMQSTYNRQKDFQNTMFSNSSDSIYSVGYKVTSKINTLVDCIDPPFNNNNQEYKYKTSKFIDSYNKCVDCKIGGRCSEGSYSDCSAKEFNDTNDGICELCPFGSTSSKHPEICEPCQNGTYTDTVSIIKGCSSCTPGYFNQGTGNFLNSGGTTDWSVPPEKALLVNSIYDYYGIPGEIVRGCKVVGITYPITNPPTIPTMSNAIAEIVTMGGQTIKNVPYSLLLPKQFACLKCPTGNFCNTVTDYPNVFTQSTQNYNSIDTNPLILNKYLPIPNTKIYNNLDVWNPYTLPSNGGAGETGNFSYIGNINKAGKLNRITFTGDLSTQSIYSNFFIFIVDISRALSLGVDSILANEKINIPKYFNNIDQETSTWTDYKKINYTDIPTSRTLSLTSPTKFSFNFNINEGNYYVTKNSHIILWISAANNPTTKATTYTSITNSILSLYIDEKQNSTYSTITKCPIGTYCPNTGHSSSLPCPAGSYCPTIGLSVPQKCPKSTYLPSSGKALLSDCIICPIGSFCPTDGLTRGTICPIGTYCPTNGLTAPINCPVGRYTLSSGKKLLTDCIICPAGSYCSPGKVPVKCLKGTFCPAGSIAPTTCPKGSYCPDDGLSVQTTCPKGAYCPNTGMTLALLCPEGTYTDATGQSACIDCPAGTFCENGNKILCNFGDAYEGPFCPYTKMTRNEILKTNWGTWPTNSNKCQSDTFIEYCDTYAARNPRFLFTSNVVYPGRANL